MRLPPPPRFEGPELIDERTKLNDTALRLLGTPESELLAQILKGCANRRCHSAACPKCSALYRLRLRCEAVQHFSGDCKVLMLTMIPQGLQTDPSRSRFGLGHKPALLRGLQRALPEGAMLFGGIDTSLNKRDNGDPNWCPHVHASIILPATWDVDNRRARDNLRERIAQHCPVAHWVGGSDVYRPITLTPRTRDELIANLLYAYKCEFYVRSQFTVAPRELPLDGGLRVTTETTAVRHQTLRGRRRAELLLELGSISIGDRLLLIGLQRRGHPATFTITRSSPSVVTNSVRENGRLAEQRIRYFEDLCLGLELPF